MGTKLGTTAVDPVVQALTLTDVVVSVAVIALILALALDAHRLSGTVDPDEHRRRLGMSWIPPLLVAIPLLAAAVTAGLDHVTPAPVQDALVIAASAATTALAFVLLWHAESHEVVHWFGGWRAAARRRARDRLHSRPARGRDVRRDRPRRDACAPLLADVPPRRCAALRRADARRARGDVRLRDVGRPLQPLRLARADGRRGIRPHGLPGGAARARCRAPSTSRSRTASAATSSRSGSP